MSVGTRSLSAMGRDRDGTGLQQQSYYPEEGNGPSRCRIQIAGRRKEGHFSPDNGGEGFLWRGGRFTQTRLL